MELILFLSQRLGGKDRSSFRSSSLRSLEDPRRANRSLRDCADPFLHPSLPRTLQDIRGEVDAWQDKHQSELRKLGVLLKMLVQLARHTVAGHKYEVICSSPQCLEIREQCGEVNSPLCVEVRQVWLGVPGSPAASDGGSEAFGGASVEFGGSDDEAAYSDASSDHFKDYTSCDSEYGYCGKCKY